MSEPKSDNGRLPLTGWEAAAWLFRLVLLVAGWSFTRELNSLESKMAQIESKADDARGRVELFANLQPEDRKVLERLTEKVDNLNDRTARIEAKLDVR